jgi:DNA-binding Lrp family transcriptional regulator
VDTIDKQLLNIIQREFPVVAEPFRAIGEKVGLLEGEVIARLAALKDARIIRQISAIFDSRALGYQSSLAAFRVTSDRVDITAEIVNAHPGVSHNYLRNHDYNLWFTITVPPGTTVESEVKRLAEKAEPLAYRLFPTIRLYKIGVTFDMTGEQNGGATATTTAPEAPLELDHEDISAIRALQRDLPLVPRPFAVLGEAADMEEEEILTRAHRFLIEGAMRRYAAVLRHREAGFTANAMVAWIVAEDKMEEVAPKMAAHPAVSHCYQRPTYPDWPFSIFTMIHGRTNEDCEQVVREITEATGISEHVLLYSTREFKKARVQYYEHEEDPLAGMDT